MIPLPPNLRMACASLRDAWRRNLLALAGLAIGVGAVVAMLALTFIVRREALRQFDRTGLDVLAIRKLSTTTNATRRPPVLDLENVREMATAIPTLQRVAPVFERRAGTLAYGGRSMTTPLLGVTESFIDLNGLEIAEGRLLSDLDRREPFVVVGSDLAQNLRQRDSRSLLGQQVTIEGRLLTIVGVLAPGRAVGLFDGDLNQSLLMHARTFERAIPGAEIGVIYAQHAPGASAEEIGPEIIADLQGRQPGLSLQVISAAQIIAEMQRQLRLFTLLLGAVGSIALVLGGAGIMNSLLVAVAERRREIGLRRALGALRADVQAQFLYEAIMLCGVGGLLGIALGATGTAIISHRAGWVFSMPPSTWMLGFGVALAAGTAAGFVPAYQASRLEPVVAMRQDS